MKGIIPLEISDHFATFYIGTYIVQENSSQAIKKRSFSGINQRKFKGEMDKMNFKDIYDQTDTQKAFSTFKKKLLYTFDQCFPLKEKKKSYSCKKPWFSDGIKRSILNKNNLFLVFRQNPSP